MTEKTNDSENILAHNYDGIQEYDNPAPSWWSLVFVASCVFAVGYWIYYHHAGGDTIWQEYESDLAVNTSKVEAAAKRAGIVTEAELARLAQDDEARKTAVSVFNQHCFACHKNDGSGLVGPNLTDDFQLYGTTRLDIYNVVLNGSPKGKGMVAWKTILPPKQLRAVAAYVSSMRNKNLPGKTPEGDKVAPFAK